MKDGKRTSIRILDVDDCSLNADAIRSAIDARAAIAISDRGVVRGVLIDVATYDELMLAAVVAGDRDEDERIRLTEFAN